MKRTKLVAAMCIVCWLIIAGLPVYGYNSLNLSADTAFSLNFSEIYPENQSDQTENASSFMAEASMNSTEASEQDSASPIWQTRLSIVDYWGNRYPCDSKCVFLNDQARTIISPGRSGLLKLYEKYPDGNKLQSGPIPVSAYRKYNWWFIGDIEGVHEFWFEVKDRRGQVSESNKVTFRVIIENCSPTKSCTPSSR